MRGRPTWAPILYATAFPIAAPAVPVRTTAGRLSRPSAAREPAKGMINSLGIGVRIPSTIMRMKIPGYPRSATTPTIQSVRPSNRDAMVRPRETARRVSRFRGRYHATDPFRRRLAVLHDGLASHEHGLGEASLHPFEGRPSALVPQALRGELPVAAGVDHDEAPVPADPDIPFREPEDLRGPGRNRPDGESEGELPRLHAAQEEWQARPDPRHAGRSLVERAVLFLLARVWRVVAREGVDPALQEGVPQRLPVAAWAKGRIHLAEGA